MTHNFLFHIQSVAPSILPPVTTWMIWAVLKTFPEVPPLCVVISPTVRGRGRGGQGRTRRRESQNSNSPEGVGGKQAHQATPSQHWTLPLCAVESLPVDVSPCRSKWRMSWHITSRSALQRVAWLAARHRLTFFFLHIPDRSVACPSWGSAVRECKAMGCTRAWRGTVTDTSTQQHSYKGKPTHMHQKCESMLAPTHARKHTDAQEGR